MHVHVYNVNAVLYVYVKDVAVFLDQISHNFQALNFFIDIYSPAALRQNPHITYIEWVAKTSTQK